MLAYRTVLARHKVMDGSCFRSSPPTAPRAAMICRLGSPRSIGFALTLLMLAGILPAVGNWDVVAAAHAGQPDFAERFDSQLDQNGNGLEDLLDAWLDGRSGFEDLRAAAVAGPMRASVEIGGLVVKTSLPAGAEPGGGSWQAGKREC